MTTPFKHKDIHSCEAVVLSCVDFRFWKAITNFVENELGLVDYDFPSVPGAAKAINDCPSHEDIAFKCISVPCDLHHVKKIVVVNHMDCGAYGGRKKFDGDIKAEREFHIQELQKAKEKIVKQYVDREVILVLAKLDGEQQNIDFEVI